MAGMAADDAPETSRPPAPGRETESDEEESSPSANLFNAGAANDAPPPPVDTYLMFLQRQESELSVNLKGQAARDYDRVLADGGSAAGEENEGSSPFMFAPLSDIIVQPPPAADQPAAPVAQADHSGAEWTPAAATAVGSRNCGSCNSRRAPMNLLPIPHGCICKTCWDDMKCCLICGACRSRSPTDIP